MLSSLLRLLPGVAASPRLRVDALCAMLLDDPVLRLPSDMPSMLARSIALSAANATITLRHCDTVHTCESS